MAETTALTLGPLTTLERVPGLKQLAMLVALAVSVSVGVTAAFWAREPGYSLLYSNISDQDAGEIVAVLSASEIPYELDSKTGAILVPGDHIQDARLKLAGQGLPRGTGFGLEMMEGDNGFSTSQFMENARYHHALETELGRTIANLRPVQNARVHLALPKNTVFLRQKRKPGASILVYLFPGRTLEQTQVASIVHLVASSVPELESGAVTVVDQHGRLLTTPQGAAGMAQNTQQFEYVRMIEDSYAQRITDLLAPMLGPNRVRATVAAELDFTVREETVEAFDPSRQAVRSEQLSQETRTGSGAAGSSGVPGALSNQPPEPVPEAPAEAAQPPVPGAEEEETKAEPPPAPKSETRRSTRNFELDRTLSRTVQPTGSIQRLSVAVLVDHKQVTNEDGELVSEALSPAELEEVTQLVREAVGFSEERGDSVSVSNVSFFAEVIPEYEEPGMLDSPAVRDGIRQALWAVLLIALGLGIIRPIVRSLSAGLTGSGMAAATGQGRVMQMAAPAAAGAMGSAMAATMEMPPQAPLSFDDRVNVARQLAERNPERVAQIVRGWVQSDD